MVEAATLHRNIKRNQKKKKKPSLIIHIMVYSSKKNLCAAAE